MNKYFYYGFLILLQCNYAEALKCFHCYGITHPRFCDHVSTCVGNEVCGIQRYTDPSGEVTYNLGCLKSDSCGQKRSGPTPTRTCVECCNKDLCNIEGCGELGHGNRTGHLCYNCKGILTSDECKHVKECFPNEACFIEEEKDFGESFFTSGCKDKHVCPDAIIAKPIIGKRMTQELCDACCTDDLCNSQCHRNSVHTQQTHAPTTESAPINDMCLDRREDCQYLNRESNICESNNDDRRNACRMTCGYCEPMGHTFYLHFSPNIATAQLIFSSVRRGVCNLTVLGSSTYAQVVLVNASSIHSLNNVVRKGYKLECDILTKLYVMEISNQGVDGYIAIPTKYLSTHYIIPSYNQDQVTLPGTYLAIISTNQATEVQISPKGKSITKASLNMDNVWDYYSNAKIDISGSLIKTSKPVAVYSNIICTSIGSCSPFSDMVIPMRDYSNTFFVPSFQGITVKSVRIYANSTCSINVYDASLNLLSSVSLEISKRFVEVNSAYMASIVSSCPSMVQFYSHEASNQKAFMTLIPGIDKYLPHYYFTMPSYSSSLLIIIETAKKSALIIDGATITPSRITEIQEPVNSYNKYSMFTVNISQGWHEAKTTNGASFGLWIYGVNNGFAFPAGYRISKT